MKPALVQRPPEAGDDLVADLEGPLCLGVDDQVGVALTEPCVDVAETVPLVGHRAHRLGQQFDRVGLHRQLALASGHHRAGGPHPVAEVEPLDRSECVVADHRLRDEQLQVAGTVADGGEHELARVSLQHDAAGHRHRIVGLGAGFEVAPTGADLGHGVAAIESIRVRSDPVSAQVVELGESARLLGGQSAASGRVLGSGGLGRFLAGTVGGCVVGAHGPPTVPKRSDDDSFGSDRGIRSRITDRTLEPCVHRSRPLLSGCWPWESRSPSQRWDLTTPSIGLPAP